MSDDLVKRLRNNCSCNFPDTPCGAEEECRNAFEGADRIEKLEAALREIAAHPEPYLYADEMAIIAYNALNAK
jgi:hypothetical protein